MWIGESGVAKDVSRGLLQQLKTEAPEIQAEFRIELPDEAAASAVYNEWQKSKDAIVFLRSTGAKFMGKHPPQVPGFIGGCSHPGILGAVENMDAPEKNITGVTYYLNAQKKVEMFQKLLPGLNRLGLIVEKGHPSAAIDRSETRAACQTLGIEYAEALCETESEVLVRGKAMAERADMIVVGSQAMADSVIPRLAGLVQTPVASYLDRQVQGLGALCALAADNEKLGKMLADSIISVVIQGKAVMNVPVKVDPDPLFILNMSMVKKLGLTIPDEVKSAAKLVN